jgi:hypothetical protein
MTKLTSSLAIMATLSGACLAAAPAQAQLSRTFVSAETGNDANNCDRPTPCRSFQGAHDKTNPDGEITVLDPGGYGGITITKSISIVNDGVGEASILVSGGVNGITVNGGPATYVNLRGITVQGIGFGGGTGLKFNSGFALTITNCVFRNHTGDGISFIPSVDGSSNLSVSNTLAADNGNMGITILSLNANVNLRAVLDHVQMLNNTLDGILIDGGVGKGTINATVTDSTAANNGRDGFDVSSQNNAAKTSVLVVRSVAANNRDAGFEVDANPTASLRIGQSTITNNATAWRASGGAVLQSFGDNNIAGNAAGDPAPPVIARK